jgi:hypothetical protein
MKTGSVYFQVFWGRTGVSPNAAERSESAAADKTPALVTSISNVPPCFAIAVFKNSTISTETLPQIFGT